MFIILKRMIYLIAAHVAYGFRKMKRSDDRWIVLCYHGIRKSQIDSFAHQIQLYHKSQSATRQQESDVIFTFDDAFANLLDNAIPALDQYQVRAIIFAVAGNLGESPRWRMPEGHSEINERTMTAEQLRAVSKHPKIRIGSHTLTHPDLTQIPEEQLRFELTESKRKLESIVGYPIVELALPHGSYNPQVIAEAVKAGYSKIYTLDPRPGDASGEDSRIGRFSMSPDAWNLEFVLTCAGAYSWLYPWRRLIRGIRQSKILQGK